MIKSKAYNTSFNYFSCPLCVYWEPDAFIYSKKFMYYKKRQ